MKTNLKTPDYVFETSWEVCNKVGGIYTVIASKAKTMIEKYGANFITIGPDLLSKNTKHNDFEEIPDLLHDWKVYAELHGLNLRIGRWKIEGEPIAILVDFTPFYNEKDKLFAEYWEKYDVDSLTGQWDYVEPFLFGYAAAKTIASFYDYFLSASDRIVAQFHEWMTGTGVLYLKEHTPQIATVFTTHATVLGRSIAGNELPLYRNLSSYDAEAMAKSFGVLAKFSLEQKAAHDTDVFTTVSELTNRECRQFFSKAVDQITPNGFEREFVPKSDVYAEKRRITRQKILDVTKSITGVLIEENALLVINSGRYEYKNKGIDLFIKALGRLNQEPLSKTVVGVIAVPAHHVDAYQNILDKIRNPISDQPTPERYLTHHLYDHVHDPIMKAIEEAHLRNSPDDKVKIIFVPSYLDGNDGVFNLSYFDFLAGFDLSVFPSYYEPWGYTPMESIAFSIPSITTTLAGFGLWIQEYMGSPKGALTVLERTDDNSSHVVDGIVKKMHQMLKISTEDAELFKRESVEIFEAILWDKQIRFYEQAYDQALVKSELRFERYQLKRPAVLDNVRQSDWGVQPEWRKVYVRQIIPDALQPLLKLSQNLWWSWNYEAYDLFLNINQEKFYACDRNPIRLIHSLSIDELQSLMDDQEFMERMHSVYAKFDQYLLQGELRQDKKVVYFSMEFGMHDTVKIFAGGLGMLAGDYLKEASDANKNMIGIGLLYRYGYFTQRISLKGEQKNKYYSQKFSELPIQSVRDENGVWQKIEISLPGRSLFAKIWRCDIGRIPLYLLDTDIEDNQEQDRSITHQLYGGDWENRLKQEMLLGVGGIQLLQKIGEDPVVYHCNEGHAAFSCLERLRLLVTYSHMSYLQGKEIVRSSTLFTTHTPVSAGHDTFSEEMLRMYFSTLPESLGIRWEDFMALGRIAPSERFSMSALALNFSQEVNGVSRIHGRVSREMFAPLYPGYFPSELHIGYVTNGVHFPTWVAREWLQLYEKYFDPKFLSNLSDPTYWQKIYDVPNSEIWEAHEKNKHRLYKLIADRVKEDLTVRAENPKLQFEILDGFDKHALTIGFARRFATYKRAHLLFSDLERLEQLVSHPSRPVQFIFAGKAHPNDKAGQDLITKIIEISKQPPFVGKILFLENYDMFVAKHLVRGVDVWLNTPERPLEASGTSGEKATMNGVLNFSVLDGWWAEGWKLDAGWMLPEEKAYESQTHQDMLDAQMVYDVIENEIALAYYERNEQGISDKWIGYMKNAIAQIAPHFTMKRQLDDYYNQYYHKLQTRVEMLSEDQGRIAREYASWKVRIEREWNQMSLVRVHTPNSTAHPLNFGDIFESSLSLCTGNIEPEYIGVELLLVQKNAFDDHLEIKKIYPLTLSSYKNKIAEFSLRVETKLTGVYDFSFRIFPIHPMMPYRMDFPLIKWA